VRSALTADIGRVVTVHRAAFGGSLTTRLGRSFLHDYYSMILRYRGGILLVAEIDGRISGFVSGFVFPQRFYRVMRARRWRVALAALPGVLRSPSLVPQVWRNMRRVEGTATSDACDEVSGCELTSLAVDPRYGRRGLGSELVKCFVEKAQEMEAKRVHLTTDSIGNDDVNRFYRSLGFDLTTTPEMRGKRVMNKYTIDLSSA
jgi:ribosomal protein S18 acetylase RimI-like enzyme